MRLNFIDYLKSFAITLVIIYHLKINFDIYPNLGANTSFNYFINGIISCSVPIFFIVNGYLSLSDKKIDIKVHITKLIRIMLLTIVWAIISLWIISFIRGEGISLLKTIKLSQNLLFSYNHHLWFLAAMIIINIFYPLILLAYQKNKIIFLYFFGIVTIFTFFIKAYLQCVDIINHYIPQTSSLNLKNNYFTTIFNPFYTIYGFAIAYFMLGGIIKKEDWFKINKINITKLLFLLLNNLTLYFLCSLLISNSTKVTFDNVFGGYNTIFTLVNSIIIFKIFQKCNKFQKFNSIISIIGKNTLGIYLTHLFFIELWFRYFNYNIIKSNFILTLLIAILILFLSLSATLLAKKIPYVKEIFKI